MHAREHACEKCMLMSIPVRGFTRASESLNLQRPGTAYLKLKVWRTKLLAATSVLRTPGRKYTPVRWTTVNAPCEGSASYAEIACGNYLLWSIAYDAVAQESKLIVPAS